MIQHRLLVIGQCDDWSFVKSKLNSLTRRWSPKTIELVSTDKSLLLADVWAWHRRIQIRHFELARASELYCTHLVAFNLLGPVLLPGVKTRYLTGPTAL